MRTFTILVSSVLGLAAIVSACTVTSPGNGDGGAGKDGGGGDGAAATKSGTASCGQTVSCIQGCPANDDACTQACLDKASPNGQSLLLALVNCIETNKCMDATCTQTSCKSELSACVSDVEAAPADAGVPPTMGAPLPATLVGTWQRIGGQYGESYTFNANGSYSSVFLYDNSGTCLTIRKLSTSIDGVAEASGSTLTLTQVKGTQSTTDCNDAVTTKPTTNRSLQYAWSVSQDGLTLTLTNDTGPSDYKKQ